MKKPEEGTSSPEKPNRSTRIGLIRRILVWVLIIVFWLIYFWSRETPSP